MHCEIVGNIYQTFAVTPVPLTRYKHARDVVKRGLYKLLAESSIHKHLSNRELSLKRQC